MATHKTARGRPREFELEMAMDVGQRLFHTHGYDGVGVAALTEALGINPPSFYKAFGSKAAYFELVLSRYSKTVLPLEQILLPERTALEALTDLLEQAARTYGGHPELRGCLVLEATRGSNRDESVILARCSAQIRRKQIRDFVAHENKKAADAVTDYVATVMSGLSASAREGMSVTRLLKVARIGAEGLKNLLVTV